MIVDVSMKAVKCSLCGDVGPPALMPHEARVEARKAGWDTTEEHPLCADCRNLPKPKRTK